MIVIARDYYRGRRWDLAQYALQAILDGADDGSIPPRDKGNGEALLLRGLIEREQRAAQAGARRLRAGDREAAGSVRGLHQPRRDEARGGQRDRGAGAAREGRPVRAERRRRPPRPRRLLPAARPTRATRRRSSTPPWGSTPRWRASTTTSACSTSSRRPCRACPGRTTSWPRRSRSLRPTSRCGAPRSPRGRATTSTSFSAPQSASRASSR